MPEVNENFRPDELSEYYMPFTAKADYQGKYDSAGISLLDYHGRIGLQYNPIAIAQYGLGNFNLFRRTPKQEYRQKFLIVADWLVSHLEQNPAGIWVWHHYFDWEYRTPLRHRGTPPLPRDRVSRCSYEPTRKPAMPRT